MLQEFLGILKWVAITVALYIIAAFIFLIITDFWLPCPWEPVCVQRDAD